MPRGVPTARENKAGQAELGRRASGHEDPTAGRTYLSIRFEDLNWKKLEDWGEDSPEIAILRVDPKMQATQLLIRHPRAMHIRRHWHSANETHTILKGTYIFECDGKREELGPGSFNYLPSGMIHEAWTPDDGMFFITVDGAWDVNWVDGPPKRPEPRRKREAGR